MGNFCSDELNMAKGKRKYPKGMVPTLFYNENSSLKIQIQTWPNQILPDLRNEKKSTRSSCNFNTDGTLILDEISGKLAFFPTDKENYIGQKNELSQSLLGSRKSKKIISIAISKTPTCYSLNFQNDFIYEQIKSRRQVQEGDKILIGGTEYKFVKFILDPAYSKKQILKLSQARDQDIVRTAEYMKSFSKLPEEKETPTCRICLGEQISRQDPLICPCDCIGTVKYFHVKCWTSWVFCSETSTQDLYIGNVIKEECQLCKKSLLNSQFYRETVAALMSSVSKIKAPFVVLEGLKPLQNFPYYRHIKLNYIILSFGIKKQYILGRGQDVDVPIAIDNSISRKNTLIEMNSGKIYVEDIDSKHGTYLKIKNQVIVNDDRERSFLFKNNLISVKIQ